MSDLDELAAAATGRPPGSAPIRPYTPSARFYPACPVCGFQGPARCVPKGSALVMIGLLLIGVLPGILYAIFYSGDVWKCASCGAIKAHA